MHKAASEGEIRIGVAISAVFLFLIVVGVAAYSHPEKADFAVPYTGGYILQYGDASKVYDLDEQRRVQEELLNRKGLLLDPYPPFHAVLFAPLTRLGYRRAYVTWGAINILLWLIFQHLARRHAGFRIQPARYLMLCSLYFPLWLALEQGQLSLLLLLSFVLCYMYLKDGQDYAAGFALCLGLLKFQAVLPLVIIFTLRRKWKLIAGFVAAAALLGLLSVISLGPSGVLSYLNLLVDIAKHPSNPAYVTIKPWNMPTIRGFVAGVLRESALQSWIAALSVILSICLILFTTWRWEQEEQKGDRARFDLMFAAGLAVSLVTAPYLHLHDLTPMLLAVILVMASPQWSEKPRERRMLILVIAILYVTPLYYLLLLRREALYVLAPVLVFFALAAMALGRKRAQQAAGSVEPTFAG